MSDPLIWIFLLVAVVVPTLAFAITQYQEPVSLLATLRRIAINGLLVVGTWVGLTWAQDGSVSAMTRLQELLLPTALGAAVALTIDWLLLRRRRRETV